MTRNRKPKKVATPDDFRRYDGGHCFDLWRRLPPGWRCPACGRTAFEIMRWCRRGPKPSKGFAEPYWGWMAGLHEHHDHAQPWLWRGSGRFPETVICDHCNSADAAAKRKLGLPSTFSFSPEEIGRFIRAEPHVGHDIDYAEAERIYIRLTGIEGNTVADPDQNRFPAP